MKHFFARHRIEALGITLLFGAFLGVNALTSDRSPVVWQDEVMFTDPAANLYLGHGFTTSAWYQPRGSFFAGNAPLYSMLLSPWIALFGFHVLAVRSLNYVLILGVVALSWVGMARLGWVRRARGRGLFALLVLCGDGVTYSYRSGRYDCLGMLLVSGLFAALTIERAQARLATLFLLGALIPWAGLQLVPYTAVMGLMVVMTRGRSASREVGAVAIGGLAGSMLLAGLFSAEGVWPEFVKSVSLLGGARRSVAERAAKALRAPLTEPSGVLLLGALAVVLAAAFRRRDLRLRSPAATGVIVGLLVPCALAFTGKYLRYYAWMAFIPMAGCLAAQLEVARIGRVPRLAALSLAVLGCAAGLPARLAVACLEWDLRDPEPVRRLVASQVRVTDWVFSEYEAYYPAKQRAAVVLLPSYIGETAGLGPVAEPITEVERGRVDVLITKPDSAEKTLRFFGGRWTRVARYAANPSRRVALLARIGFGAKPYDLIVYRRADERVAYASQGSLRERQRPALHSPPEHGSE